VVDEVGVDAVRFMMLYRKNDAVLDFDMAKVKEQSKDNPVFYVQVRPRSRPSIFRNAAEQMPALPLTQELHGPIWTRPTSAGSTTRRNSRSCARSRSIPGWSKRPPWPMSRTGWRSTFMNWRANSTRMDKRDKFASFTLHYPR